MPIVVSPNTTMRYYRWTDWKSVNQTKNMIPQYDDDGVIYTIWGYDGPEVHICQIWKDVIPNAIADYTQEQNDLDKVDFETNYKSIWNQSLEKRNEDGMVQVNIANSITEPVSIVLVPAVIPGGATKVSQSAYNSISSDSDTIFIIPDGVTLVIQMLSGSAESKSQGCAVELWYDPNGNGVGMTIIDVIHVNGSSEQHSLYQTFIGNGTRKIRMRRRAYAGGSRECFGRWEGYY